MSERTILTADEPEWPKKITLLTTAKVAKQFGQSVEWVDALVEKHPHYCWAGRTRLFTDEDVSELERIIRRRTVGLLYVVGFADYVKIGFTADMKRRMKALQHGAPEKLVVHMMIEGSREDEASLHKMFAEHRLEGEWFRFSDEIREWVRAHNERP